MSAASDSSMSVRCQQQQRRRRAAPARRGSCESGPADERCRSPSRTWLRCCRLIGRCRGRALFSAAVIGSMVPDFGLLLPGIRPAGRPIASGRSGTFCLPVGLVGICADRLLIKPALTEVLPDRAYVRLRLTAAQTPPRPLWRTWLYAAPVIVLGAVTHLVWDGFTHENARGVRMFPLLDELGPEIDGHALQLFRWLQYGSSLLGLVAVVVALLIWMHHAPARGSTRTPRRLGDLNADSG